MTRLLILLACTTAVAVALSAVRPQQADAARRYVAPSGHGSACSAAAPCGSLRAAYHAARPGDVVLVRGGSYGPQVVPSLGRGRPAVEFRAARGASVVFRGLDVRGDWVTLRGMRSSSYLDLDPKGSSDPIEHVRFFRMRTKTHYLANARDFVWRGGRIGPTFNEKASFIGGVPVSRNITYDRVLWHDAVRNDGGVHMECLYAASVDGLTIRNSRFTNCAVFDVFITRIAPDPQPRNVVFENNVFEHSTDVGSNSTAYAAFALHQDVKLNRIVLRHNVWEQGWQQADGAILSGRVVGNIGESSFTGDCRRRLTYSHNVFTVRKCGSTDRVKRNAFSQFVNPSRGNWSLKRGAAAIDAGDPGDFPARDAVGNRRPAGRAPDAGPVEFGAKRGSGGHGLPKSHRKVRVTKVLDGRTLRVKGNRGRTLRVRLLGVKPPGRRCGGRNAKARLRALAPKGRWVVILRDTKAGARDRKGRTLAYVTRSRRDVGRRLIATGWARVDQSTGKFSRRASYAAAARKARDRKLGLWRCS